MERACRSCEHLHHPDETHANLIELSALPGSRLYKCGRCHSFLHRNDSGWEIFCEGSSRGKEGRGPISAVQEQPKHARECGF